jgi:hypothetical protein
MRHERLKPIFLQSGPGNVVCLSGHLTLPYRIWDLKTLISDDKDDQHEKWFLQSVRNVRKSLQTQVRGRVSTKILCQKKNLISKTKINKNKKTVI